MQHARFGLHAVLLFVVFCIGLTMAVSVSPFDKPDEDLHFLKSVAVSRGNFVCQTVDSMPVNPIPRSVLEFVQFHNRREEHVANPPVSINDREVNEITSCVLPFMFYLLPGSVIYVLGKLNFDLMFIFYSGRIINFVLASVLFLVSLRGVPAKARLLPIFLFSIPMNLFQLASYSKDAYHLMFGLVLLNLVLRFCSSQWRSWTLSIALAGSLAMVVLSRPQFFPFILLFLLLQVGRSKHLSKSLKNPTPRMHTRGSGLWEWVTISITTLAVVTSALWILILSGVYLSPYNQNISLPYSDQINPSEQLRAIIVKPLLLPKVIGSALLHYGDFYFKGLIGIFGWVDQYLPNLIYVLYIFLLIFVIWHMSFAFGSGKDQLRPLTWRVLIVLSLVVTLTTVSTFAAMYLYASPVENFIVYGIQGRYFLLLLGPVILIGASLVHRCMGWARRLFMRTKN